MSHACWTACQPWNCACAAKMRQAEMAREQTATFRYIVKTDQTTPMIKSLSYIRVDLNKPEAMRPEDV